MRLTQNYYKVWHSSKRSLLPCKDLWTLPMRLKERHRLLDVKHFCKCQQCKWQKPVMVWTTSKWEKDNGNEALKAVTNNGYWEDDGEQLCQENIAQMSSWSLEIHKDALRIHVNNKIWKVTNESTQGKLNKKHLIPQVLYTDGHESRVVWETIPSRLKIRKEAREMQCFDHFLEREYW